MLLSAASIFLSGVVGQATTADDQQAIDTKLAELRADVAELRAACDPQVPWLSSARAEEVRTLVRDVLADADTRANLQEAGMTAGRRDRFFLASEDGNWLMNVQGYTQVRYAFDYRSSSPAAPGDSVDTFGASIRRMRFQFEGTVVDPTWRYKLQFVSYQGSVLSADDIYIEKVLAPGLSLRVGQFNLPFLRESLIPDSVTTMVDRAGTEFFFSAGRGQGIQLTGESEHLRASAGYFNGFDVKSNYFSSGSMRNQSWDSTSVAEYCFMARAEWKVTGTWAQFKDFSGWRKDEFGVLVGVAGEIEKKGNNAGTSDPAILPFVAGATVDIGIDWPGASVYSYFVWRQVDPGVAGMNNANQYGFVIQGGYFIADTVELTARYEYGNADTMPNGGAGAVGTLVNNGYPYNNAVTVGANWYINGQFLKLAWDVGYAFDGVGAFASPPGAFLEDGTSASGQFDQSGQVLARMQVQLMW